MRPIKFRVWIKDEDIPSGSMSNSANNLFVNFAGDVFIGNFEGKTIKYDENKVILMQFTGLKDKNGKEIYEGDILLYSDTEGEYVDVGLGGQGVRVAEQEVNNMALVEYKDGEFGIMVNALYGETLRDKQWYSMKEFIDEIEWMEIIGNLYESPELLK